MLFLQENESLKKKSIKNCEPNEVLLHNFHVYLKLTISCAQITSELRITKTQKKERERETTTKNKKEKKDRKMK